MILNKPFSSFQVDSLSKRWAAALLLLFAWGVSFMFLRFPPGDPDFSQFAYWMDDLSKAEDYVTYYDAHPLRTVISSANLIYLGCFFLYIAFMHLVGLFYFTMYVCDLRKVPFSKAPKIYFTRIWWLILYSVTLCIPGLLALGIFPFIYLFAIPAFYARPGLVLFDKMDVYKASLISAQKTRGHKFSIFLELVVISMVYTAIHFIITQTISAGSTGMFLVEAFLRSYIVLAIFRNMGARFHILTAIKHE